MDKAGPCGAQASRRVVGCPATRAGGSSVKACEKPFSVILRGHATRYMQSKTRVRVQKPYRRRSAREDEEHRAPHVVSP